MNSINDWLKHHGITEVECLVPDMTGNARGKFIPADKFINEDSRLPEAVLLQTVTGDYTEAHDTLLGRSIDGDMYLKPDPSSLRLVPWAKKPTAQIIHDCLTKEGLPHPLSTRNVLKRVLSLYQQQGWRPIIAPEVEFYLVKKNLDPDYELEPPKGRSGRSETARQSYSIDAVNEFEPIIEDMYDYCEAQNLSVDTLNHESGAGQMELNFIHGDALDLADQVFTFKRTLRETALSHNIYATFMAKPMTTEPGSAMHIHQSIVDINTGRNIFIDESDQENMQFKYYIGGLQKFIPHAIAFFAPNVNSYRRFARDISAPVNLSWGYDNRTTGIRIPESKPQSKRVENRFPGVDTNPYLAIAASLACGFLGMRSGIEPGPPCGSSAYDEDITIPRNLEAALKLLDRCEELRNILGDNFVNAYIAVKEEENEAFNRVISSWEREHLLLNV